MCKERVQVIEEKALQCVKESLCDGCMEHEHKCDLGLHHKCQQFKNCYQYYVKGYKESLKFLTNKG